MQCVEDLTSGTPIIDIDVQKVLQFLRRESQTKSFLRTLEKTIPGVGPRPIALRSTYPSMAYSDFEFALTVNTNKRIQPLSLLMLKCDTSLE